MKRADRVSGIFWLILAAAICIHAYQLGLGSFADPGPGFLFFWSGLSMGVLAGILLLSTKKGNNDASAENQKNIFADVKWIKVVSILASLVIYGLILERLGFLLSTVFLIAFLLRAIEYKKWYIIASISIASSLLSYALFELLLEARLPKGIFGI